MKQDGAGLVNIIVYATDGFLYLLCISQIDCYMIQSKSYIDRFFKTIPYCYSVLVRIKSKKNKWII